MTSTTKNNQSSPSTPLSTSVSSTSLQQQTIVYSNSNNITTSTFHYNFNVKFNEIANSIAVNRAGTLVCLGGKKSLQIVDLELLKSVKNIPQQSKWEVSVVDWNNQSPNLVASSSNQDTFIWDIENPKYPLLGQFASHQRAISDLSWSLFDNNILATTSADSFVNIWDLRSPKKAFKFKSLKSHILGAIQVKWNRFNSNVLASAHESYLMIWDIRKDTQELNTAVHSAKVYGIDWSHQDEKEILTCSQDKTVKIWNYPSPRPKSTIITSNPILRAKYLPVGNGIITISDRGENHIRLWESKGDFSTPLETFVGHTDNVRSFDFRVRQSQNDNDIQIVSWSKDQYLRLWKLEDHLKDQLGIEYIPYSPPFNLNQLPTNGGNNGSNGSGIGNSSGITGNSLNGSEMLPPPTPTESSDSFMNTSIDGSLNMELTIEQHEELNMPKDLEYELKIIQNKFIDKYLKIDQVNLFKRTCVVICTIPNNYTIALEEINNGSGGNILEDSGSSGQDNNNTDSTTVQIRFSFPVVYPNNACPSLEFITYACTTPLKTNLLIKSTLNDICWNRVSQSKPCFEQCLIELVKLVKQYIIDEKPKNTSTPQLNKSLENITIGSSIIEDNSEIISNNNNSNNIGNISTGGGLGSGILKKTIDIVKQPFINLRSSSGKIETQLPLPTITTTTTTSTSNTPQTTPTPTQFITATINKSGNNNNNNNLSKSPTSPKTFEQFKPGKLTNGKQNEIIFLNNYKDSNEEKLPLSPILTNLNNLGTPTNNSNNNTTTTNVNSNNISNNSNSELSLSIHRNSFRIQENYPCPRLCGAVFGGCGKLIVFRNIISSTTTINNKTNISTTKTIITNNNNNSGLINNNNNNNNNSSIGSNANTSASSPSPSLQQQQQISLLSLSLSSSSSSISDVNNISGNGNDSSNGNINNSKNKNNNNNNNIIITKKINPPRTYKELLNIISTLNNSNNNNNNNHNITAPSSLVSPINSNKLYQQHQQHQNDNKYSSSPFTDNPLINDYKNNLFGTPPKLNSFLVSSPISSSPVSLNYLNHINTLLDGSEGMMVDNSSNSNTLTVDNNNNNDNNNQLQSVNSTSLISSSPNFIKQPITSNNSNGNNSNSNNNNHPALKKTMKIIDTSSLSLLNENLANSYILSGKPVEEICKYNSELAEKENRKDLVKLWNTLGMITDSKLFIKQLTTSQQQQQQINLHLSASGGSGGSGVSNSGSVGINNSTGSGSGGNRKSIKLDSSSTSSLHQSISQNSLGHHHNNNLIPSPQAVSASFSTSISSASHSLLSQTPQSPLSYHSSQFLQPPQSPSHHHNHNHHNHQHGHHNNNFNQQQTLNQQQIDDNGWPNHPLGRTLVKSLIDYYKKLGDIQTLAVISCILILSANQLQKIKNGEAVIGGGNISSPHHGHGHGHSPMFNFTSISISSPIDDMLARQQKNINNNYHFNYNSNYYQQQQQYNESITYDPNLCLLDATNSKIYDYYRQLYSDVLYRWGLFEKRAEVLKFIQHKEIDKGVNFSIECLKCNRKLNNFFCNNCKIYAVKCSICNISVRGLSSFCLYCGHGGHTNHIKSWFEKQAKCPTGCGCICSFNLPYIQKQQYQQQLQQQSTGIGIGNIGINATSTSIPTSFTNNIGGSGIHSNIHHRSNSITTITPSSSSSSSHTYNHHGNYNHYGGSGAINYQQHVNSSYAHTTYSQPFTPRGQNVAPQQRRYSVSSFDQNNYSSGSGGSNIGTINQYQHEDEKYAPSGGGGDDLFHDILFSPNNTSSSSSSSSHHYNQYQQQQYHQQHHNNPYMFSN